MGRAVRAGGSVAAALAVVVGCSGGGGEGPAGGPLVGDIDEAVAAVEAFYGSPQEYVEVSATDEVVSLIVAVDDTVEQAFWQPSGGLTDPVPVGSDERPTFRADTIAFDPASILDGVAEQLPDSEIVDFAVTGNGAGGVVYDARLRSSRGGVLLVLLAADGTVLGAQGE